MAVVWFFGGGKETVIGLENIPRDRAVLFVGNHRSLLDVVLAGKLIPFPVGFIAKMELQKVPLLNLQMRDINCLFIDRKDDRQALKVVLKAIEMVKGGQSMFVFPEGTRSKEEGVLLPFHAGSFKIATKAKAPIVPVTIVNMGDVLEDHFPRLKRVPVVIEFGEPIERRAVRGRFALRKRIALLQIEHEDIQPPRGGDLRIELPERPGGGVARIGEERQPLGLARGVQFVKDLARHIDLATHDEARDRFGKGQGDRADGAQVCRHVLADQPVAPRRAERQSAVFVGQGDRKPVDLRFDGVFGLDIFADSCIEIKKLILAENILQ